MRLPHQLQSHEAPEEELTGLGAHPIEVSTGHAQRDHVRPLLLYLSHAHLVPETVGDR